MPELGHANVMVSDQEWSSMHRPMAAMRGFLRNHIELDGLRWKRVHPEPLGDPAHDQAAADRLATSLAAAPTRP